MLWATVPEATIDEDGDPRPAEHDVGASTQPHQRGVVHVVPKASPVKDSLDGHLGSRVSRCDLLA